MTLPIQQQPPGLIAMRRNRLRLLEHHLEGELSLIREALDALDQGLGPAPFDDQNATSEIYDEVLEEAREAAHVSRPSRSRGRRA